MSVKNKLKQVLERQGWKTVDGVNYEATSQFGYDWVSLTLGKKVGFYGRCYPAKEGWEISTRSYSSLIKALKR